MPPVLVLGEGEAAGDGLTVGLGVVAGAVPVSPPGEGDDVTVLGEFDSLVGSLAQPAASRAEDIVRTNNAMRLIDFKFGVVIIFPHRARL